MLMQTNTYTDKHTHTHTNPDKQEHTQRNYVSNIHFRAKFFKQISQEKFAAWKNRPDKCPTFPSSVRCTHQITQGKMCRLQNMQIFHPRRDEMHANKEENISEKKRKKKSVASNVTNKSCKHTSQTMTAMGPHACWVPFLCCKKWVITKKAGQEY